MKVINRQYDRVLILIQMLCLGQITTCLEKSKSVEIFHLKSLTLEKVDTLKNGDILYRKSEYFVIANPPEDTSLLKRIVKTYNDSTISQADIQKYISLHRYFFRETRFTPRDYKESNKGYFNHDRIEFHAKDVIMRVTYSNTSEHESYYFFKEDELP